MSTPPVTSSDTALAPSARLPDPATPDLAAEAALIRAAAGGDSRSFGELVRTHQRRVYNFLHQMTRHRQDAEDLTQQTFIKAYHNLGRFDPQRPLINWLLTIARHSAINHFRDTKRWSEIPEDTAGGGLSPARAAEVSDRTANLWDRARAVLSAREFEIMWLRFGEELSTEETARVVGLTQTHVKVLVFRARRTLMKGEA
ncbi:sigma-70 family RNA polymerase sigma factor [Opitutus sp. ER46]|uniref:RNA polymerase sigma factor n=1 Tax=Opitutus sp. ER46 TaxID=2161864 RepID=UPI001304F905|nr:sigma-70 family RNA polymerase sigma factor [Opitutus sp. ER46]